MARKPLTDEQKARRKQKAAERYLANRDAILSRNAQWYRDNKARHQELMRDWFDRNAEKRGAYTKAWRERNPDKARELAREHAKRQRETPWGHLTSKVFRNARGGLRHGYGDGKYNRALGYSWRDLRAHIEQQFTPEMTWENWGLVWEIDHIVPLSKTKYESLEDPLFRQAWALSNIRPLPVKKNREKWANPDPQSH